MRRSDKVLLTSLFITAISSYSARGQDAAAHHDEGTRTDSAQTYQSPHSGGGGFHTLGHPQQPNTPVNYAPRTSGFGNTLRTSYSASS